MLRWELEIAFRVACDDCGARADGALCAEAAEKLAAAAGWQRIDTLRDRCPGCHGVLHMEMPPQLGRAA